MTARCEESLVREARDEALAVLARDDSAAEASRTLAGAVALLADVLDAHRPRGTAACPTCETAAPCPTMRRVAVALVSQGGWQGAPLERGAAWARADAHFNRSAAGGARRLVLLSDLGAFFVARGGPAVLAEPPQVPVPDGETVLVLDKGSGRMSRWPLLPDADLIVQYWRYLRGEPMILAERPLRPRLFQRGAWTIRSSPIP